MDRRNFFTNSILGATTLLLTGALPKNDYVPGCCPLKPFPRTFPLVWNQDKNVWEKGYDWDKVTCVKMSNGNSYEVVRIDGEYFQCDDYFNGFGTFISGCILEDFNYIYEFEENVCKREKKEGVHLLRYLIVNKKGKFGFIYGMVANKNVCYNFTPVKV